jgi:hypothetical protein
LHILYLPRSSAVVIEHPIRKVDGPSSAQADSSMTPHRLTNCAILLTARNFGEVIENRAIIIKGDLLGHLADVDLDTARKTKTLQAEFVLSPLASK